MRELRRYSNPNIVTRLERVLSGHGRDRVSHRPGPSLSTNRTRIDVETLDRLAERYAAGDTLHALASEFSIERALLADLLRERGVEVKYRLVDEADVAAAAALYGSGLSLAKVGEQFGVSAWSVLRAFRSAHVAVRPSRRGY